MANQKETLLLAAAILGRKGGKSRSAAKIAAVKINGRAPKRKKVENNEHSIQSTDNSVHGDCSSLQDTP